jgi:hypothetical protein
LQFENTYHNTSQSQQSESSGAEQDLVNTYKMQAATLENAENAMNATCCVHVPMFARANSPRHATNLY